MTNKFAAALMAVWLLAGTAALAQSKPDFSGDWVLNKEKSVPARARFDVTED
jgi:hypothetical protein